MPLWSPIPRVCSRDRRIHGVASLDGSGKIPQAQVPQLGAGYFAGPFGPTATFAASATNTPARSCDWNLGATGVPFYPEAYMSLLVRQSIWAVRWSKSGEQRSHGLRRGHPGQPRQGS